MGPPPPPTNKNQTRPSLGTTLDKASKTDPSVRPSRTGARSLAPPIHRQSLSTRREYSQPGSMESEETSLSPTIDEEEIHGEEIQALRKENSTQSDGPQISPELSAGGAPEVATSQTAGNRPAPARTKQESSPAMNKELEQMKAKYKIMERKRMEDRDKLKTLETLKAERDKFESTLQKLQRKCQTQSQEIAEWRRQLQEAEAKVEEVEKAEAAHGTELEMATLDKEMAEERLEAATAELKNLKERCEELELEAEIMHDENKELTSGMTSEERSSAGWLQMEKENRRLRDALVALRDMSRETEAELKSQVKELKEDLSDFDSLRGEHEKTKSDLEASQATIQTLKENVDAAENQELVVAQLTEEKEALTEQIKLLSKDVMALKEEIEVSKEIQNAQDESERFLLEDLDDARALARERDQKMRDQEKKIDNLESTLVKFRDAVTGLQNDLEQLRANKQLSEAEKDELSVKSKAMMDINLRLQSTAAKTQAKMLDSELHQIKAEDTALHLAIVQNFLPETFKDEKNPILALLRFKRIASKASLLRNFIRDDIDHTLGNGQGDRSTAFDVIEKLQWISLSCSRAHSFMKGCTAEEFSIFDAALHELEPVERTLDVTIDAAKRKDLDGTRCSQNLQRMIALLSDLAEKTIPSVPETFTDTACGRSEMMQLYFEVVGHELESLKKTAQNKVEPNEEDSPHFGRKIQELIDRSRTSRVMAGKVLRAVEENKNRSMAPDETSLILFEQAESLGKELSDFTRVLIQGLFERINNVASGELLKFEDLSSLMQQLSTDWLKQTLAKVSGETDALGIISEILSRCQSQLEVLANLTSDISNFSEYERHPTPWTVRAKTLRERKVVDPQMEEQLRKLQSEAHEHNLAMNAKNQAFEEQNVKIELLEARTKGAKDHASALQRLEKELADVVAQRDKAVSELEDLSREKHTLEQRHEEASAKLVAVNQNIVAGDPAAAAAMASMDQSRSLQLKIEIEMLKEEVANLQSAVRFLKGENHRLLFPISSASLASTTHAWLEANPLPKLGRVRSDRGAAAAAEAKDVLGRLMEVSYKMEPVKLENTSNVTLYGKQSSWRPIKMTPRYLVSQQREELEKWSEWRDDLLQRTSRGQRRKSITKKGKHSEVSKPPGTPPPGWEDAVEILGSPP